MHVFDRRTDKQTDVDSKTVHMLRSRMVKMSLPVLAWYSQSRLTVEFSECVLVNVVSLLHRGVSLSAVQ